VRGMLVASFTVPVEVGLRVSVLVREDFKDKVGVGKEVVELEIVVEEEDEVTVLLDMLGESKVMWADVMTLLDVIDDEMTMQVLVWSKFSSPMIVNAVPSAI